MNDKYQKLYQYLSSNGMTDLDMNSFYNEYSSNPNKVKKLYSYLSQNGLTDLDEGSFSNEYFAVKKKEVSQSTPKQKVTSSAISKTAQKKPSVSSGEAYNWNGQDYVYRNNKWEETALFEGNKSVPQNQKSAFKKVTDRNKIKQLNYQFKKDVSLDPIDQVYSNYDEEKKDNEYRVNNGTWQRKVPGATSWTTITNEGSVSALNRRYNQNVKYTPEVKIKKPEPKLKFADVNTSLVAKTEEDAVGTLSKKYGKYGFTFEQSGYGTDYVTVYNKDRSKEITIGFDEKNPEEALKLKTFLEQNASQEKSSTAVELENKIKKLNTILPKGSPEDMIKGTINHPETVKYVLSDDYKNKFSNLSFDEMKNQINGYIKTSLNSNDLDKFYKSETYKVYQQKKKEEFGARDEKIDLLYTELQTAKASGNKNAVKNINSKITTYLTNDVIQDQVKDYSMQLNDLDNSAKKLASDQKKYLQSVEEFNSRAKSGQMTQEEFDQNKKMLDDQAESLSTRADFLMSSGKSIQNNQKKLNVVAGKYVTEKSKAGGFFGGVANSLLIGVSKVFVEVPASFEISIQGAQSEDAYNKLSPEEKEYYKQKGYTKQQTKNLLDNERLKNFKSESRKTLINAIGSDLTTEEYMKSKDRGFFEKAIYGVAESVPAMALGVGGYSASFAGLAAQSYSSIEDEMINDPDFETLSAGERAVVAVPYAIVMGVLENYGLKNVVKGQSFSGGVVKNILASSIKKMPKGASREVLQSIMDKEVKNLIAKGSLRIINGAIAEFETGATQSLVLDIGLKSLYNKLSQSGMTEEEVSNLSGGEMFATPDSAGEIASTVLEDGLAEAVGGATIGTFTTVSSGLMNGNISLYNEEDLDYLREISQDSNFKKIIVANLKTEMLKGNLTKSEAQERLDSMNELSSVIESIPDGLTKEDQIDAVNMLSEKNRLTREIQGKDPALVTAQTERINEINEELKTISKNAIQVETTGEVFVQPEAIVSREVEEGKPKTESQDFTEKSKAIQEVINRRRELLSSEEQQKLDADPIEYAKKSIKESIDYYESMDEINAIQEEILQDYKDDYNTLTAEEAVDTEEDIKAKEIMPQLANAERTMIQLGRSTNPNNTDEVTYTDLSDVSVKDDFTPFYKSITDFLRKNNEVTIYDKANNKTYNFKLDGNTLVSTLVPNVKAEATQVEAQPVVKPVARKSSKQNLVTQENVEELRAQQTTPRAQKILTAAKLVMKSLPSVNIYIHKNKAEYEAGINEVADDNEYGSYLNGEIHINLEGANVVTILHEAMHHALVVKGIKSGAMIDLARGLKSVISDKQLKQRLERFTSRYKEEDDRSEEYAAELGAIMAEAKQELTTTKFQQFKNLINKIAKKLGLPVVFSASANAKDAVDFMNSLTKAIRTGENIEPYTSGESATVIKDAPLKVRKKRISEYAADFIAKIPTKTLKEIISKYEGRIFFVQSDATGVGYDSKGDPIYGGLGYITIKENVDGSIGFASVDDGTAKTTISKMINRYGEGKKVAVFVMIQNPSSTVGNYYGAKYFGRALIQLQKKSKTNYKDIANSFIDYIKSNKKIVDELNKNKTQQKLIDLIKNPEKYNEKTFADEFIKDTTFEARRNILESLIPVTVDVKTNKSTPYIKQSLKDIGFSRIEFLKEYGDNTLFTEDMYLGNEGGFLAAGFEIELPKKEQLDEFISKYKNNGIKHPQFNGKLPNTGESFLLDGLYPVNENFVEFAKDETIIDKDVLSDEELKKVVQENFPNDSFYEDKFTSINSENYIPRENRTYSHLKSPNKIIFKSNLEKTNPKALKSKTADVATNVARGMGFSPEVGEKQKQLTQKTEFTKREAQAKRKKQLSDSKDIAIQKAKEKYTLSVEQRGNPHQQGVDASLNDLRKSDWYNTADDTQRENAERELKEFFGERLKKAPSAAKVLGKPKAKKVAIKDEYKAMITQIKMEAKAAREAKADLNSKRKMLAAAISGMVKTGKIKASQASVLVKRVSNLNLDNPVMVERFTNYAERVFERADYQQRLDDAFALRKSIRKLLKTDNQAEVSGMAKAFTKIDPSLVDDIDAYIEMADKVKNAVKPSRVKGLDVVMKEAANIAEISEYTSQEIERQEDIQKQELLATYDFLEGEMSLKDMQDVINALKDPTSQMDTTEKEKYVKDYLNGRFGIMSSILDTMFKTGIDPMTGEEITFDEKQKELIKRALNINLNEMSVRDAIKIVESLENFITNQITSGIEAAVSSYEGAMNVKSLVNRGKKAKSLRLFFSNYVGKIYSEQLFSFPMLMEKMFGGVTNSLDVMNKMGLTKLIYGVNKANRQHNDIIDQYAKQEFYKSKDFMDAENVYERGMLAFLKRNLVGSPAEMKSEFGRRVRMIQESINKLIEDGDPKEQKMGELYQKIYDKLGVSEMDMDVINANASKNNLDAVNWWVNQWSQHYSDLSDVSLSVYNTQLGSDLNYTPDKYKRLSSENQSLDEGAVERNGSFAITIDYTDKNKTGVLMETTRPNVMPDGRYISLDFDNNNSKALKSALTDINTASAIRQVDGFINSKSFKKLIPESEDRSIMTKRINTYIRRSKGKNIVPSDTIQYLKKLVNFVTSLGVGKALGGINQAVMQTTPVMVNTFANAGRLDFAGADFNAWLNKSGLPISNRGLESQSTVESIDRKIDMKGTGTQEALKAIANLNQWYLKQFLVKPDVFVARSSFKSYYLQNLKRRGISTDIDWTTHEMDMEAAEYAQSMIDRQQNISDPMLAGEFLSSDDPIKQIARKVILPFASFILNQKARMYNDFSTITSKTAIREDKIIAWRSLAGLATELAAYQMIGFGIRRLYDMIAASLLGDDDDEETKKKKLINATKYPIKSIVNDIVSPIPMTDGITTWGLNQALAQYPWMSNKEIKDAVESRNKVLELKGEPNMTEAEEKEFIDRIKEEATYQVFEDDFDRRYGMIGIVGSTYQELGEMSKLATTGEFTDEYQGRETTKVLLESDREKVKYAVPFMIAYSTGLLPKDVGAISRNYVNRIKKKAITEKQYERYDAVQKDLGRNLKSWEIELVKAKKEAETAVDEVKFIERNGGLTESQGREYLKLMKAIGEPNVSDIVKIKAGQTADQILK